MPDGLTKMGYDDLIDRISDMRIETPTILTATGLQIWIQAYTQCQDAIIDLIAELRDKYGR